MGNFSRFQILLCCLRYLTWYRKFVHAQEASFWEGSQILREQLHQDWRLQAEALSLMHILPCLICDYHYRVARMHSQLALLQRQVSHCCKLQVLWSYLWESLTVRDALFSSCHPPQRNQGRNHLDTVCNFMISSLACLICYLCMTVGCTQWIFSWLSYHSG